MLKKDNSKKEKNISSNKKTSLGSKGGDRNKKTR